MATRLEAVQELKKNFKEAFMPVPPHPDFAQQAPQGAPGPPAGAPPPQGAPPAPPQGAPPGAPPQGAPAPTDPATGAPIDPATGAPVAEPGPPPINPDVIALLQETTKKVEEMSARTAEIAKRQEKFEQELAHDRALRDQRKTLIDTLVQH